jgi:hypothetical protein
MRLKQLIALLLHMHKALQTDTGTSHFNSRLSKQLRPLQK